MANKNISLKDQKINTSASSEDDFFDEASSIAHEMLGIDTLLVRNRDAMDFHEVHVADLYQALKAAYEAGRDSMED